MFRGSGLPLVCLAVFSIAGGHWTVLQTVAWARMLRDFSRDSTLTEAIAKTFDGEHPCDLCKSVKAGRENEEKIPEIQTEKKLKDFTLGENPALRVPPGRKFCHPSVSRSLYGGRMDSPDDPVPRFRV